MVLKEEKKTIRQEFKDFEKYLNFFFFLYF